MLYNYIKMTATGKRNCVARAGAFHVFLDGGRGGGGLKKMRQFFKNNHFVVNFKIKFHQDPVMLCAFKI